MSDESGKLEYLRRKIKTSEKGAAGQAVGERDHCSFCGKHKSEIRRLFAGPSVYICDECIIECSRLLGGGRE